MYYMLFLLLWPVQMFLKCYVLTLDLIQIFLTSCFKNSEYWQIDFIKNSTRKQCVVRCHILALISYHFLKTLVTLSNFYHRIMETLNLYTPLLLFECFAFDIWQGGRPGDWLCLVGNRSSTKDRYILPKPSSPLIVESVELIPTTNIFPHF